MALSPSCNVGSALFTWSLARTETKLVMRDQERPSSEATFCQICIGLSQMLDGGLAVFLETDDTSGPHKARVALRRLTTALDAFMPILRRKQAARLRAKAKRIFRRLGEVRDSDVHLQNRGPKVPSQAQVTQNQSLRRRIREVLRKDHAVVFSQAVLQAAIEGGAIYRRSTSAQERRQSPVSHLAADALGKAWDPPPPPGCLAHRSRRSGHSPRRLHDFRKAKKPSLSVRVPSRTNFPGLQQEPFRSDFRAIQNHLGTVNDHDVASQIEEGGKRPHSPPPEPVAADLDPPDQVRRPHHHPRCPGRGRHARPRHRGREFGQMRAMAGGLARHAPRSCRHGWPAPRHSAARRPPRRPRAARPAGRAGRAGWRRDRRSPRPTGRACRRHSP